MPRSAGLDVSTMVRASLEIADADGLDGLSMRRLSSNLGVSAMALYHHVEGKEQLLDLMLDESLRALPALDVEAEPAGEVVAWFLSFHRLLVDHPALAQVMATRRLEGRVAAEVAEGLIAGLRRAGASERGAVEGLVALFAQALGTGLYRVSRRAAGEVLGARRLPELAGDASDEQRRLRDALAVATVDDEQVAAGLRLLVAGFVSSGG